MKLWLITWVKLTTGEDSGAILRSKNIKGMQIKPWEKAVRAPRMRSGARHCLLKPQRSMSTHPLLAVTVLLQSTPESSGIVRDLAQSQDDVYEATALAMETTSLGTHMPVGPSCLWMVQSSHQQVVNCSYTIHTWYAITTVLCIYRMKCTTVSTLCVAQSIPTYSLYIRIA